MSPSRALHAAEADGLRGLVPSLDEALQEIGLRQKEDVVAVGSRHFTSVVRGDGLGVVGVVGSSGGALNMTGEWRSSDIVEAPAKWFF